MTYVYKDKSSNLKIEPKQPIESSIEKTELIRMTNYRSAFTREVNV